jgi:selenocysteine-specific translation elongation factor
MPNLNAAVLGAPEYAKGIGKKSTASDITFYDVKQGDVTVSLVEPTMYPEKLAPLFYSTSLADVAIVVVDALGPAFGETAIMLDCIGVKKGFLVLRNYITPEQTTPLTKGTVLEGYTAADDDPLTLRETLLSEARKLVMKEPDVKNHSGSVPVDHYFDVKGVGTVVLGCVAEGMVRRHDSVKVLPSDKEAEIRSIQKHDDDFDWAVKGDRVGFALKGVSVDDLDRGTVLTNNSAVISRKTISGRAELVRYWSKPLAAGMIVHLGHWMQFEPAKVESVDAGNDWRVPTLTLSLQKDLVYISGSKALITYLEGSRLRVAGTITLQ